jgi:hypothetical protein
MQKNYTRLGTFSIAEVLDFIVPINAKKTVDGFFKQYGSWMVKMQSQRYSLFKEKGVECVECGLKGDYFGLDLPPQCFDHNDNPIETRPHFNLYGLNCEGTEVLFTKDHIHPKAKGGKNNMKNYQTMCSRCNEEKKDTVTNI